MSESAGTEMSDTSLRPGLPPIERRTLRHAFERVLATAPAGIGVVDVDDDPYTFRELYQRSLRAAGHLAALGEGQGAKVAFMLDNSADLLSLAYGLGLTRRVQVPVNTAYKGTFLAHVLRDSGATTIVVEAHYLDRLLLVADAVPALHHVLVRGDHDTSTVPPAWTLRSADRLWDAAPAVPAEVAAADLWALMYTSGTTGASKGVEVSHAHAYTYASREDSAVPGSNDRVLVALPMFHLAGQWFGAYQALIAGATCILRDGFSVSRFWEWTREHEATTTVLMGAMGEMLLNSPEENDAANPMCRVVMAPMVADVAAFQLRFGVEVAAVYGMSEIGAALGSEPPDVRPGEAGTVREGYQVRIVDSGGTEVARGASGELWVRPEHPSVVMSGYHGLPERTAETLVDGWVRTGDVFRQDEDGHFYFVDRLKDSLRRRGENVSSFEVESTVNTYPDVIESAVVGVASELGDDEIKAVVVTRPGTTLVPADLLAFLIERLPYFMVPRYVEVLDALPKTPTHKVQKHKLRTTGADGAVWDREAAGIHVDRRS
jgi:carnitine-CoA ligase